MSDDLQKLPEPVRDVYRVLLRDVMALKRKRDFYLGLFDHPEHVPLFDLVRPAFHMIEEAVGHDLVMTICRLGDPADTNTRQGSVENLTFEKLAQKLRNDTKLGVLVKDYQDKTAAFRTLRNKLYAHSDLEARIGSAPVPQVHKNELGTAFEAAEAIINHVAQNYLGHSYGFGFPADAEALLAPFKARRCSHS